ncbi:MAG: FAD-dependent monooxygenase [Planctomycetota bacterium]
MKIAVPDYDVGIIGAGPAGSFCAYLLANAGFKVLLLEASAEIKRKICGEYLCPTGLELLRQQGFGEYLETHFLPIFGMKLVSPTYQFVKTYFPDFVSRSAQGISVPRDQFDTFLFEKAKQGGVHAKIGIRALRFHLDLFWNIQLSDQTSASCKILIGADGRRSIVAKHLNLHLPSSSKRVAVHCFLQAKHKNERLGEMHIFDDGSYIGINPVEEKRSNISLVCDVDILKKMGTVAKVLHFYLNRSPLIRDSYEIPETDISFSTTFPITYRTRSAIGPQCALIGDASGFIDPLTGEGIYNALWTAHFLAQKLCELAKPLEPKEIEKKLQEYARGKKRQFRQKVFLSKVFQNVIQHQSLCEGIAFFLIPSQKRANIFIGIIGNVYNPLYGLFLFFKSFFPQVGPSSRLH